MTELTAMTMAATARHSIGNGGIDQKDSQRLCIKRKNDGPDKPSEPDDIFASGNDGAGQNCSPDSALDTRSPNTIDAHSLIASPTQKENAAQPHRSLQVRADRTDRGPHLETGWCRSSLASPC